MLAGTAAGRLHVEYRVCIGWIGRRELELHFGPIDFQLLCDQHWQRSSDALAHLCARDHHRDGIIGTDAQPSRQHRMNVIGCGAAARQ
jgi:hypothetical protein